MPEFFTNFISTLPVKRSKTAAYISMFAGFTNFLAQYIFTHSFVNNLALGIGTAIITFIAVWLLHLLVFNFFKSSKWHYALLIAFPFIYIAALITAFGSATTIIDMTWFNVPLINQMYIQIWSFLGKSLIYLAFSPKIPFFLTCLLVLISFYCGLKNHNSQSNQD